MASYIDVIILGVVGALLLLAPRLFTKAQDEAFVAKRRYQIIGLVLLVVAGISALLSASKARAEAAPEMVMHRKNVEEKDSTGGYPATSTGGNYSVRMPMLFSDYTVTGPRRDGTRVALHCIAGRTADGIKFTVTAGAWSPVKPDLKVLYERNRKDGRTLSVPAVQERDGLSTLTYEMTHKDSGALIRYILTETMIATLMVGHPSAQRDALQAHAR